MPPDSRAAGGTRARRATPAEAVLPRLRQRLVDSGYSADWLTRRLGIQSLDDVGILNHGPTIERLRGDASASAALTRLFFLETTEPIAPLQRALGRELLAELVRHGYLRLRGRDGWANLRIDPCGEQHFLSDLRFRTTRPAVKGLPRGDDVYPPSSDSVLLRNIVTPAAAGPLLDLCTGSGVQGLQQAAKVSQVVAVDINPRAVAMARRNAELNQVETFEAHLGDLYTPVQGRRFEVVLANPPFVVSPYDEAPSFHAGGPRGDRVLRRVLAGLQTSLAPGGRAFAVSHVGLKREDELEAIAAGWFRRFDGRGAVLLLERGNAVDLAAAQALFALREGTEAYAKEVRRWVTYLERHRIRFVALILVVAERRGTRSVEVIDSTPRILPLPMTPGPEERVKKWLG